MKLGQMGGNKAKWKTWRDEKQNKIHFRTGIRSSVGGQGMLWPHKTLLTHITIKTRAHTPHTGWHYLNRRSCTQSELSVFLQALMLQDGLCSKPPSWNTLLSIRLIQKEIRKGDEGTHAEKDEGECVTVSLILEERVISFKTTSGFRVPDSICPVSLVHQ